VYIRYTTVSQHLHLSRATPTMMVSAFRGLSGKSLRISTRLANIDINADSGTLQSWHPGGHLYEQSTVSRPLQRRDPGHLLPYMLMAWHGMNAQGCVAINYTPPAPRRVYASLSIGKSWTGKSGIPTCPPWPVNLLCLNQMPDVWIWLAWVLMW
jgi:hypothetical protein